MIDELFVKVCGITRAQDAELASGLGAKALGFVFWPKSPRYIAPRDVLTIGDQLPPHIAKVGVFVDEAPERVAGLMLELGLDAAQLHGREDATYCRQLLRLLNGAPGGPSRIIKAVGMKEDGSLNIENVDPAVMLLVDAHDPERHGGTGRTVNWQSAREIADKRRMILSGGLNASNIRIAVRSVRPYGVDVSSGVESAPGVKDPVRLRQFFEALHD
jgi:phosphoribosylanthranilate isomerase